MGTTADKLQYLIDAKSAISAAIEAKGGTVPTELSGYGPAIEALPSGGGSSDLAAKIIDRSVMKVTAADLNGITSIGSNAFHGCSGLTSITIPNNVTHIGTSAFQGCSGLTSITIPDSVSSIGNSTFQGCSGLTSITIPDSVSSIGEYAFRNCSGLTSLVIPNSVTSIGNYAFYSCPGLTSAVIGNGVTSIGDYAFNSCSSLVSITIGNSVTSIGRSAFAWCSNCLIFDFSNHTSVPTLANTNAFQGTNANKKIIVPDDLYDSWKAANNWKSTTNGIVNAITKASEA